MSLSNQKYLSLSYCARGQPSAPWVLPSSPERRDVRAAERHLPILSCWYLCKDHTPSSRDRQSRQLTSLEGSNNPLLHPGLEQPEAHNFTGKPTNTIQHRLTSQEKVYRHHFQPRLLSFAVQEHSRDQSLYEKALCTLKERAEFVSRVVSSSALNSLTAFLAFPTDEPLPF